ncbi:hypothetical protein [Thermaurantiacus sp.]
MTVGNPDDGQQAKQGTLLVRRIAHDLATPVGALAVALELDPAADPLLKKAVAQLTALVELHRGLFGAPPDAAFDPAALRPLLGERALEVETGLDAKTARALTALALEAAQLLAGPGAITMILDRGCPALVLRGRVRPPEAALAAVLAGAPAAEPGTVCAALAVRLLGPFTTELGPDQMRFVAAARP